MFTDSPPAGLSIGRSDRHLGTMRQAVDHEFVEKVREVLVISDALGLCETSLHLNAALTTLDGKGFAPDEEQLSDLH